MFIAVVAVYWFVLLGAATAGLWLRARGRRLGLLLFAGAGALALGTIYEPDLDEWVLARSTAHPTPPQTLVIRAEASAAERIAAALRSTGFDLLVAPREASVVDAAPPALPGCRIEIKFDGAPGPNEALAQTAQVVVVRDAGVACPYFGRQRNLPDSVLEIRGLLPYVSHFGQASSTVPSMRLLAIVPSPTRDSLLQTLSIDRGL
jgi:hypothetical protein